MNPRRAIELAAVLLAVALFAIGLWRGRNDPGDSSARTEQSPPATPEEPSDGEPREAPQSDTPIRFIPAPGAASELPFSAAVVAGHTVHLSGTLGLEPETRTPPKDAEREAKLAMNTFKARVELAGAQMSDVVSVKVFCSDPDLYDTFNAVYREYFPEGAYPARAFIITRPLLFGARFEVAGIAQRRD